MVMPNLNPTQTPTVDADGNTITPLTLKQALLNAQAAAQMSPNPVPGGNPPPNYTDILPSKPTATPSIPLLPTPNNNTPIATSTATPGIAPKAPYLDRPTPDSTMPTPVPTSQQNSPSIVSQSQPSEEDNQPPIPEDTRTAPEIAGVSAPRTFKDSILGALKGVGNALDFSAGQAGYAKDFDFIKRLATGAVDGATGQTNPDGSIGRGISVSPYEIAGAASQTLSPAEQEIQKAMFNRPDLQDLLPNRSLPFFDPQTGNVLYWGNRGANGQIIPNGSIGEPPIPGSPQEQAFLQNGVSNNGGGQTTSQQTPNAPSTPGVTPMAVPATQYNLGIQHSILGNQEDIGKRSMKFGNAYPGDERNKTASTMGQALNTVDQNLIQLDQAGKTGDINTFRAQGQLVLDQLRATEQVMPRGAQQQILDQEITSSQSQFNEAINSPNIEALYPAALASIIKAGTTLRDNIKGQYDVAASAAGVQKGDQDYNKFLGADSDGNRTYTVTQKAFVDSKGHILNNAKGYPETPDVTSFDKDGIPQYRPNITKDGVTYNLQSVPVTYNQDNYIADLKKKANNNNLYDTNSIATMKGLLQGKASATGEAMAAQSAASKIGSLKGWKGAIEGTFANGGNTPPDMSKVGRYNDQGNYMVPTPSSQSIQAPPIQINGIPSAQEKSDYHQIQIAIAKNGNQIDKDELLTLINRYPNYNGWGQ